MTENEIIESLNGSLLSAKDLGDIVAAPFMLDRFDSESSVCRWINEHGLSAFRKLMSHVEKYHNLSKQIRMMSEYQRHLKNEYGIRI